MAWTNMRDDLSAGEARANAAADAARAGVDAAQSGLAQAQAVGRDISGMLGSANALAGDATRIVNGTDADVDALRSLVPQVGTQVAGISGSADALGQLAARLRQSADSVAAYAPQVTSLGDQLLGRVGQTDALAGQVQGVASGLQPHVDALSGLSEHLFGHGHDQILRGNSEQDQAVGLRNLDAASSPYAAEWRRIYDSVNPETYAARAAADVQAQGENALQQQVRDVARRGGSLTSGAALTLRGQLTRALATARAAATTAGRKTGYDTQAGYLKDVAGISSDMMKNGTDMFNAGVNAERQSAATRRDAADIAAQMGTLYANAADIFGLGNSATKGAGDLYGAAAGIEEGAAKVLGEAADAESAGVAAREAAIKGLGAQGDMSKAAAGLDLSRAGALNDAARTYQNSAATKNSYLSNLNDANRGVTSAYGALASALEAAANYYLGGVRAASGGGGGGGGVNILPEQQDFWERTGHSQTWWKNTDPAMHDQLTLMAAAQEG